MKVSVLGTGLMGLPMSRRLCDAGYPLTVWNRTLEKARVLGQRGATVASSPVQAVAGADIVVTILGHGGIVEQVLFDSGVAQALERGALVIDMSSILPAQAREHARRLESVGVAHLDAPVSGGTVGAEAGTLAIMVGGEAADVERAATLFKVWGRATHVGPHGAGQLAKLANQMIVGITVGAVAEALLFAQRGGADAAKVREAMRGGFAESRILEVQGGRMLERDFAKRGSVDVVLKDLRNALATASEYGFQAPITQLFESLYASASANGLGDVDHTGLFVELARRNGMQ